MKDICECVKECGLFYRFGQTGIYSDPLSHIYLPFTVKVCEHDNRNPGQLRILPYHLRCGESVRSGLLPVCQHKLIRRIQAGSLFQLFQSVFSGSSQCGLKSAGTRHVIKNLPACFTVIRNKGFQTGKFGNKKGFLFFSRSFKRKRKRKCAPSA